MKYPLPSKIYLFSYKCATNQEWTQKCIHERKAKLYDIKSIHDSAFLIKTTEDIQLLEKYLKECFDHRDTYFIVDISDQPKRFINVEGNNITGWMDDL